MSLPRNKLKLLCGRTVSVHSLRQWSVYAGLLEGLPTRERNDADLARIVAEARQAEGHEPFVIAPTQKPIEYNGRYPFGQPAALPAICCVARLHSFQPAQNSAMDCSDLTVIWFQDDYAFPLSEEVERQIYAIDWTALAHDDEY
jgi:hypothetical protein